MCKHHPSGHFAYKGIHIIITFKTYAHTYYILYHVIAEMGGVWVLGLPNLILPNIKERQFVTKYEYRIYLGYNVPLISIDNGLHDPIRVTARSFRLSTSSAVRPLVKQRRN